MNQLFKSKIFLRQFFSFFFIICFTFITISIILLTTTEVSLEGQQLNAVENYRIEASKQIMRWLEGRRYSIKTNASYISQFPPESLGSKGFERLIKEQISWDENLEDILIIDKEGLIINSVAGAQNINLSHRDYFMEGLEGKSSITGLFQSAKGSLIIAVSEPIIRNGQTEALVVGIISVQRLREVVESLKFGKIGHAYLVSNSGTFVTASKVIDDFRHNQQLQEGVDAPTSSYAIEQVRLRKAGTKRYTDFQEKEVFGSYQWLDPLEVGLIVEFNRGIAMKPLFDLIWVVWILAGAFLLVGLFLAYQLSRRIVGPIQMLVEATGRVTSQDYQGSLMVRTDSELDILVESFNQMQSAIETRENQLEKANEELREQRAEAMQANLLKSQFLANMSHELRTPLNSIIGFTTRVIKKSGESLPPVQLENLQIVKEEAQHLLDLINNLLDYSKIEAGKMEVHNESFNLIKVIDEVNSMVATLKENKPVVYEQELYNQECILLRTDRMKVKQILINLLSNAFKYSDEGTVKLIIMRHQQKLFIKVQDEGVGIAPEHLESIFDEFRQVDGSYTRKVGGTGLGLSITKRFVQMLGGEIKVESELGVGTCFTIILPLEIEAEADLVAEPVEKMRMTKKRIICIEDDPNVQRLYKQYLNDHEFEVIGFDGREDVIQKVKELQPEVILLDIILPVKDGWEILSELKNSPETRKIPVIMISVLSEENLAFKMRADDYLIKPVTQNEVIEAIERSTLKHDGLDVLIADDDENYLNLVSQFLREEGYSYRLARNGQEALERVKERKPDLLILDIMMPEKDGFSVIQEVQQIGFADLPIIVVTAKDLTSQERMALRARTQAVIQKSGSQFESVMQIIIQKIKESKEDGEDSNRG